MPEPRRVARHDGWEHQWLRLLRWYHRTLDATGRDTGMACRDTEDFSEVLCRCIPPRALQVFFGAAVTRPGGRDAH